jgi:hypothetical protein
LAEFTIHEREADDTPGEAGTVEIALDQRKTGPLERATTCRHRSKIDGSPLRIKADHVASETVPVTGRPRAPWNPDNASMVCWPKIPSGSMLKALVAFASASC